MTARYAALMPFDKVAALLSELLPISGAQHASTVRNRTLRAGREIVQAHAAKAANQPAAPMTDSVVVGLDGGYVRSRHEADTTSTFPTSRRRLLHLRCAIAVLTILQAA